MSTWADMLQDEILDDEDNPWYLAEDRLADNNQLRLKFVNGNLNYYYFPNMVSLAANKEHRFNANLPVTLKFCQAAKSILDTKGPFGRMIVHRLPAGKFLSIENTDIEYYQYVITSLFVLNSSNQFDIHNYTCVIPSTKGSFFQFQPISDRLRITNNSNGDMYFLTFDNWLPGGIKTAAQDMDPYEWLAKNPERRGIALTPKISKMLYISNH